MYAFLGHLQNPINPIKVKKIIVFNNFTQKIYLYFQFWILQYTPFPCFKVGIVSKNSITYLSRTLIWLFVCVLFLFSWFWILTSLFNQFSCHFLGSEWVKVAQSCLILRDSMDYTVHGILQARILEWVAVPFSRGSSQSRDGAQVLPHFKQILYLLSHQGRE